MLRALPLIFLTFILSSCGPPLVWGGDDATKGRLLRIVPIGSTTGELDVAAKTHEWRVLFKDDRTFAKGVPHYVGNGCEHQGGVRRTFIVAEYGLLTTSVEAVWLFDQNGKLGSVCVRRTTDAL